MHWHFWLWRWDSEKKTHTATTTTLPHFMLYFNEMYEALKSGGFRPFSMIFVSFSRKLNFAPLHFHDHVFTDDFKLKMHCFRLRATGTHILKFRNVQNGNYCCGFDIFLYIFFFAFLCFFLYFCNLILNTHTYGHKS